MRERNKLLEILGEDHDWSKLKFREIKRYDMSDDERLRIDDGEWFD